MKVECTRHTARKRGKKKKKKNPIRLHARTAFESETWAVHSDGEPLP